jgi:hypothetical protein
VSAHFRKDDRFFQGVYDVQNPSKYAGLKAPIFRSSYEAAFFHWCDTNDRVVKWGSEIIEVPYQIPLQTRTHKYVTDAYLEVKNSSGTVSKYLVEIKPKSQTVQPRRPTTTNWKALRNFHYAQSTFVKNMSKWRAASAFAQARGMKFMLLTEDDLSMLERT